MLSADLRYDEEHEWVKVDGDVATIGISDFAQEQLGEVVYVDLPSVGDPVTRGESFGEIESVEVGVGAVRSGLWRGRRSEPGTPGHS